MDRVAIHKTRVITPGVKSFIATLLVDGFSALQLDRNPGSLLPGTSSRAVCRKVSGDTHHNVLDNLRIIPL